MTTPLIKGRDEQGRRIGSMDFEKLIREAARTSSALSLEVYGQHNIGIRLQRPDGLRINVKGPSGQRLGCMGMPGTNIVCDGSTSDDVGYLNIGAEITVLGNATNGACNAMAGGKVFIGGSTGARGLTMTKWNPDYARPELWVLGSVGDSFAEFNCGGVAVVCGLEAKTPKNVLGYRPCVGMVGGWIFFRGEIDDSYAKNSARLAAPNDEQWQWLCENLPIFLQNIRREELLDTLLRRDEWQMLIAVTPQERAQIQAGPMPMAEFRQKHWNRAFGGDPLRDIAPGLLRGHIPAIVQGELRRKKPWWINRESAAPCAYYCPIHIPTGERLRLIREGKVADAYELLLRHTPLPASVCGAVCPQPCMDNCSRGQVDEVIVMQSLGRAVGEVEAPASASSTGKKVAIIGGGPAAMSAAWQLALAGIEAHIFEQDDKIGGKLAQVIPWERLPRQTWEKEVERFLAMPGVNVHLNSAMTKEKFLELKENYDFVIVAAGTHEPRRLNFPGSERVIPALDFLKTSKSANPMPVGKRVVIIGAGNVGCDVAYEAYQLGAETVTLVDIQKPLAFGKERENAEKLGATFRWPVITKAVTEEGLVMDSGEVIPADTVIISIGDVPALPFLPETVATIKVGGAAWITTGPGHQTSDAKVLATGDVEKPGLATDAMGAGKTAAEFIIAKISGQEFKPFAKGLVPPGALTLNHYAPRTVEASERNQAERCLSCATCRDCHLCETICPTGAISRKDMGARAGDPFGLKGNYVYASDDKKCIACGFCADTCPCGIWVLRPLP
ncbi:MAG: FAD-dependent oxidoreductase [Desulfobulbaceae bacterium]|nr:FAD-dependent oxidoreductase [Desulfobulbaceae bacterium]